ncbi:MAG: 30S ribosomal protein S9 [Myxococcota bacterium]
MTQTSGEFAATGRRKEAVARVRLEPGDGSITVNRRSLEDYIPREVLRQIVIQPLEASNAVGRFRIQVQVRGGGMSGQAGAIRHGIARALERWDPNLRPSLKRGGFLTRDARAKERKKYGQRGARARFQFSKR